MRQEQNNDERFICDDKKTVAVDGVTMDVFRDGRIWTHKITTNDGRFNRSARFVNVSKFDDNVRSSKTTFRVGGVTFNVNEIISYAWPDVYDPKRTPGFDGVEFKTVTMQNVTMDVYENRRIVVHAGRFNGRNKNEVLIRNEQFNAFGIKFSVSEIYREVWGVGEPKTRDELLDYLVDNMAGDTLNFPNGLKKKINAKRGYVFYKTLRITANELFYHKHKREMPHLNVPDDGVRIHFSDVNTMEDNMTLFLKCIDEDYTFKFNIKSYRKGEVIKKEIQICGRSVSKEQIQYFKSTGEFHPKLYRYNHVVTDNSIGNLTPIKPIFSRDYFMEFINYNKDTGEFTFKKKYMLKKSGDTFGKLPISDGYLSGTFMGISKYTHHWAWYYMTGEWPKKGYVIDHLDNVSDNNAWDNLRLTTQSENCVSTVKSINNRTGYKGVRLGIKGGYSGGYISTSTKDGEGVHIGHFNDPIEAARAYDKFIRENYTEALYLNFPDPNNPNEFQA